MIRNWLPWLAIYGFASADRWLLGHWPDNRALLEYMKFTYGWCLMPSSCFCVLYSAIDAKDERRLTTASTRRGSKEAGAKRP